MKSNAFLQLPPGTAGLFLEDAARHQAAIDATSSLYTSWGYTMVHTPMVDFFDAHREMISDEEESRIYRLIGREGEVLMLRSDITTFLLKHYQNLLKGADFPVRLSYSDSILRHEDRIDISRNDHYQTGAELIGTSTQDGDTEILLLLCENLDILNIEHPALHLGSRAVFNRIFKSIDDATREQIQKAILTRDWVLFAEICGGVQASLPATIDELVTLFSGISGEDTDPASLIADSSELGKLIAPEIEYLGELARVIRRQFPSVAVRIDLSEIGQRSYYSGLVFTAYHHSLPYPLASGGRYDDFLSGLGIKSGAVGYSLMLSAVRELPEPAAVRNTVRLGEDRKDQRSIEERYEAAKVLRKEGTTVCL